MKKIKYKFLRITITEEIIIFLIDVMVQQPGLKQFYSVYGYLLFFLYKVAETLLISVTQIPVQVSSLCPYVLTVVG